MVVSKDFGCPLSNTSEEDRPNNLGRPVYVVGQPQSVGALPAEGIIVFQNKAPQNIPEMWRFLKKGLLGKLDLYLKRGDSYAEAFSETSIYTRSVRIPYNDLSRSYPVVAFRRVFSQLGQRAWRSHLCILLEVQAIVTQS